MNNFFIEISKELIINSSYIISIQFSEKRNPHYEVIEGEFDYYLIVRNLGIIKITKEKYIEIKKLLLNEKLEVLTDENFI